MTRKTKNNNTNNTTIDNAMHVRTLFEIYENLSVRNVANTLGISYHMLLKASKAAKVGEVYDPTAINYDAMQAMIDRKEIRLDDYDWETIDASFEKQSGTVIKDHTQFKAGDKVYLRKHKATPYTIIYTTDTHVVILLEGSTEPQAWKWSTFLFHGPSNEPRQEDTVIEEIESAEGLEA